MITKEDIKDLADLARIEVSDSEAEGLTSQIDSILGYVGQIQNSTGDIKAEVSKLRNVMRDDFVTNGSDEYTEKLLNNAPSREGRYFKVKKIL
jgi:aspartyl-tRNA(Asn)/glutamyl-tRNA(Gln) amidotransferase subunit C